MKLRFQGEDGGGLVRFRFHPPVPVGRIEATHRAWGFELRFRILGFEDLTFRILGAWP